MNGDQRNQDREADNVVSAAPGGGDNRLPPPKAHKPRRPRRALDLALFALLATTLTVYYVVPYVLWEIDVVFRNQQTYVAWFGRLAAVLLVVLMLRFGALRAIRWAWSRVFPIELGWRSDRDRREP